MRVGQDHLFHLTYCTNIHAGQGWEEVLSNIRKYAPGLKQKLSPNAPFGLGLRLSSKESDELVRGNRLECLKEFLEAHQLYVFTLNGFAFGSFHGERIKSNVFAPDWTEESRVSYTCRLIEILKRLLPRGVEGGISTVPLSYKQWVRPNEPGAMNRITRHLVRVVEELVHMWRERTGFIHLDLEPEPDGLIENSKEVVDFFEGWLLPVGGRLLAESLKISSRQAHQHLLDHIQVCLDTCHMAVAYEDPEQILERFSKVGIKIGKVQISSALRALLSADPDQRSGLKDKLKPFAESIYLHQVIEKRKGGALCHYPDLTEAMEFIQESKADEWRIHFHIPIFIEEHGIFKSTQNDIKNVLDLLRKKSFSRQIEIETYTWDFLPSDLKLDLLDSIEREYRWILKEFLTSRPLEARIGPG